MADGSVRPIGNTFMAIDRKTIFEGLLDAGYIKNTSVVLIKDTQLLWIHGVYVGGVNAGNYILFGTATSGYVPVTVSGTTVYNLSLNTHTHQYITGSKVVNDTTYAYTLDAVSGGSIGGPLSLKYLGEDLQTNGYMQLLNFSNDSTAKLHDNTDNPTIYQGIGLTYESRAVNGVPSDCTILDLYNEYGFRFHDLFEELSTYDANFFTYNGYPILTSLNKDNYAANLTLSNVTPGSTAYINIAANPSATSIDDMGGIAQFATTIINPLYINGTSYNGGDDPLYIDYIDIPYGGTGKTLITLDSHVANPNYVAGSTDPDTMNQYIQTNGWFLSTDFTTNGQSISLIPYLTGTKAGENITGEFNGVAVPVLEGAEKYALITTATGLQWTNMGVFLEAASAMVFKGTVNCATIDELNTDKANHSDDAVLQAISGLEVPWFEVEIGWTYVVTDREFELHCSENTYGTYGTVEVGDLLICMERGYTEEDGTAHIALWAVVQNKTSDVITYGTPTITSLTQDTNGAERDYVAVSMGATPLQIKYNDNFYIDDRNVMHGKFEGIIIAREDDPDTNYAGFSSTSLTLTFTSASGTDVSGLCLMLSSNTNALRISSSYGNLTYDSTNPIWEEGTGVHTVYYIYEISGTTATLRTLSELTSMSTGLTKQISIISLGKDDGEYYSSTNNIATISHSYANITDYNTSLSVGDWLSGKKSRSDMHSTIKGYLATEASNNIASRTTFTLTKTSDGFTILSSDGYYLNKYVAESLPTELTGGSYYNPIYIDNDEVTHETQIYLYNLMNLYTSTIATWGDTSRNARFDSLYNTYRNDSSEIVGYGKNLVIPVNGAKKLLNDSDIIRSGAILQWSDSTNTIYDNLQLFGDISNNRLYFRAESGNNWGAWNQIAYLSDISSWALLSEKPTYTLDEISDGTTRILPTKTSDLINDGNGTYNYITTNDLDTAIGGITSFDYQVVSTLPETGIKGTVYLTPLSPGDTNNTHLEYLYINSAWELIGSTGVNVSGTTIIDVSSVFATTPSLPTGQTLASLNGKNLCAVVNGTNYPVVLKYNSSATEGSLGLFYYVDFDGTNPHIITSTL